MRRAEQHAERDGPLAITLRSAAHTRTKADHTSVHTICSLLGLAHRTDTRARACRAAGRTREGGRREGRERYLALGGVAVEARLGRPVAPALAVVHVHGEVEVEQVAFHDMRLRGLGEHGGDGRCWRGRGGGGDDDDENDEEDEGRECVGARDGVVEGGSSILKVSERGRICI